MAEALDAVRLWWSFVRTRGRASLLILIVVCTACAALTHDRIVTVLSSDRATNLLVWASCAPAALCAIVCQPADRRVELSWPHRRTGTMRGLYVVCLIVIQLVPRTVATVATASSWQPFLLCARNGLFVSAIALMSALVLPSGQAWVPGVFLCLMSWFAGTKDLAATPRWWDVVDRSPTDTMSWVVAVLAFAAATAGHVVRVPRT